MGKLSRFLHLERARPNAPGAEAGAAAPERFEGTPPERITADASDAPAEAPARFREPAPPETLALAERDGGQPFVRCARCEGDSNVHATRCVFCGESLTTEEQRLFNERLWAKRVEEKRNEDEELERVARARSEHAVDLAQARREAAAAFARAEGDRLRREYGWSSDRTGEPSIGLRLLRRIPDARWRMAVIAALVAVPVLLLFLPARGSWLRVAGFFATLVVSLSFMPPGWNRRRGDWWRG